MINQYRYPSALSTSIWGAPLLYLFACFFVNYLTGALDYSAINDVRSQRDFNAALGMPLLTAFFWIAIRGQQQQMASTIMSYLLDKNALSQFSLHRRALALKLRQQTITAATLAITVTSVYIISEELVAVDLSAKTLALDLIAVPFWFFFWLFLFQMISSTHYMIKHFVHINTDNSNEFKALKRVAALALENTLFGITALVIIPVFWFNKSIPAIDVFILTLFSCFLSVYLFLPALKVYRLIDAKKEEVIDKLSLLMSELYARPVKENDDVMQLQFCQQELEAVEMVSAVPVSLPQFRKVVIVVTLVPLSWLFIYYIEQFIS